LQIYNKKAYFKVKKYQKFSLFATNQPRNLFLEWRKLTTNCNKTGVSFKADKLIFSTKEAKFQVNLWHTYFNVDLLILEIYVCILAEYDAREYERVTL